MGNKDVKFIAMMLKNIEDFKENHQLETYGMSYIKH